MMVFIFVVRSQHDGSEGNVRKLGGRGKGLGRRSDLSETPLNMIQYGLKATGGKCACGRLAQSVYIKFEKPFRRNVEKTRRPDSASSRTHDYLTTAEPLQSGPLSISRMRRVVHAYVGREQRREYV